LVEISKRIEPNILINTLDNIHKGFYMQCFTQWLVSEGNEDEPKEFKNRQSYEEFVDHLTKTVHDPKAKKWLEYAFGGENGDIEFTASGEGAVAVKNLIPTQNFIGLENSIGFVVNHPDEAEKSLTSMLTQPSPTIKAGSAVWIFEGKYIIDGHHRWSQVYAFNPDAKIVAVNFKSKKKLEPKQALAAVQGVIAQVVGNVPVSTSKIDGSNVKASNVLQDDEATMLKAAQGCMDSSKAKQKFIDLCTDILSKDKERKISGIMSGFKDDDSDGAKVLTYAVRNCLQLKKGNNSIAGAPDREYMPQTDGGKGASKNTPDQVKKTLKGGVDDVVTKVENYIKYGSKVNENWNLRLSALNGGKTKPIIGLGDALRDRTLEADLNSVFNSKNAEVFVIREPVSRAYGKTGSIMKGSYVKFDVNPNKYSSRYMPYFSFVCNGKESKRIEVGGEPGAMELLSVIRDTLVKTYGDDEEAVNDANLMFDWMSHHGTVKGLVNFVKNLEKSLGRAGVFKK